MGNPWFTSDDLLESVKRKISFPASQNTFQDTDILAFANEELAIAMVPAIMSFHEEYFVTFDVVPIIGGTSRYQIPERAIGMKLRGVFWCDNIIGPYNPDSPGNLFDMTRVSSEDKAFFQANIGANSAIHKYYLEGDEVILTPPVPLQSPIGSLVFFYFLRPNQLTTTDQASTVQSFSKSFTVVSPNPNDTVTVFGNTFTAVSGAPSAGQFQIGGTDIITATNLAAVISSSGISANTGTPNTNIVTYTSLQRTLNIGTTVTTITFTTSNPSAFILSPLLGLNVNQVPTVFKNGDVIDCLQTRSGHKLLSMSVVLQSISGLVLYLNDTDVDKSMIVGDYVCEENQCIIPMIPSDLHTSLAERTSARILAAIGDQAGLTASNQKIAEMEKSAGSLLDNRTEGEPRKVLARHSMLRYLKMGTTRRL